jgi:hypothetical protein
MLPIEVFVGLDSDAARASAEEVPGLPKREKLKQWLVEQDKVTVEKKMETFDLGELKKIMKGVSLVQLTRMLSLMVCMRDAELWHSVMYLADIDLMKLTLTTIYAFSKSLHLLRDRSDNWELLSVQPTQEEGALAFRWSCKVLSQTPGHS